MEQLRKQLMAKQPDWGDPPSPLSSSPSRRGNTPRDDLPAPTHPELEAAELDALDALIMAEPKQRARSAGKKPPAIFSCKGWTLQSLLSQGKNFVEVPRVRWSPQASTAQQIRQKEAANPGVPLVVGRLHKHASWNRERFTPEWLEENGPQDIIARNVREWKDKNIPLSDFIAQTRATSPFAVEGETERLYGKDVPCPPEWNRFLHTQDVIPPYLTPDDSDNLLNNLPESDRVETLMCYLGVGDTFTPCHKDLCASSGHNLMCYTENGGSSFWFMTATSSANAAAEYFHNKMEHELDHETHVITVEELAKAPFTVYIAEQKLGDLVLVPPRSAHQVINSGGITIKTSWSRMTLDGLSLALRYELPLYRRVCRNETYRVKHTIYHTLRKTNQKVSVLLAKQSENLAGSKNAAASSSQKDMRTHLTILHCLISLFDSILIDEYSKETKGMPKLVASSPFSANGGDDSEAGQLTCDYCGADVFQSFFECRSCVDGGSAEAGAGFVVCPGCYVEGRSCQCEAMEPMQYRPFADLLAVRGKAVDLFKACWALEYKQEKDTLPSQRDLLGDDKFGIFRAALVLQKTRARAKNHDTRRCTGRTSHVTSYAWILTCKQCRSGTCFAHFLTSRRLHSAEALLAQAEDDKHSVLHKCHKASQDRYESELAVLKLEPKDGIPDPRVQLAYLTSTFTACKPVGKSKFTKSGFYDLTVWEIDFPTNEVDEMVPAKFRKIVSKAPPKPPKRYVMECVLLPALRSQKRKERPTELAPTKEHSGSQPNAVEFNDVNGECPPRKKTKRTHATKGPPGIRPGVNPSASNRDHRGTANKPSGSKKAIIVLDSSSDASDTEEQPAKKARVVSRSPVGLTDLRFKKKGPQTAVSVADAFNNASAQNSKALPASVQQSSSSSAAPPSSRKHTKRRALPIPSAVAPSSSDGPDQDLQPEEVASTRQNPPRSSSSSLPRRSIQAPLPSSSSEEEMHPAASDLVNSIAHLTRAVSELQRQAAQQQQQTHQTQMAAMLQQQATQSNAANGDAYHAGGAVKVLADLVTGLVSTLAPNMGPPRHYTPSRGFRGRGRGGGPVFGDHAYRSSFNHDYQPDYRHPRQYHGAPAPFGVPLRQPRQYNEGRLWFQGPNEGRRVVSEGQPRYDPYAEERREAREPRRSSRRFTRFSPPNSPGNGNGLDLVPVSRRHAHPVNVEGNDTGSEATVMNADGFATNAHSLLRQTPAQGNNAGGDGASAPREKFFPTLNSRRASIYFHVYVYTR
ncbi:hypothetical protein DFH07DRAFT_53923 [Mycena maculata]|uniref:JmjC domain-containing protein n=1 Tax=Mycena maculata TaxID=230809 RepID=A0AAD7IG57_9AGAR|nr:hypothetical protein DFH07DRAFT_53923 [Mycena maculata]